jgi:hypothetical protein
MAQWTGNYEEPYMTETGGLPFAVGDELVIRSHDGLLACRVKATCPVTNGEHWLILEEPQTKTVFRRLMSSFVKEKKVIMLSTGGKY